jgi:hypothetical protein
MTTRKKEDPSREWCVICCTYGCVHPQTSMYSAHSYIYGCKIAHDEYIEALSSPA